MNGPGLIVNNKVSIILKEIQIIRSPEWYSFNLYILWTIWRWLDRESFTVYRRFCDSGSVVIL